MFDLNNILFARQIVEKMSEEREQQEDADYDPILERPRLIVRLWRRIAGEGRQSDSSPTVTIPSRQAAERL